MTANDLTAWRKYHGWRRTEAARRLGVSPNTLRAYENGQKIPPYIGLACAAIAAHLSPWRLPPDSKAA